MLAVIVALLVCSCGLGCVKKVAKSKNELINQLISERGAIRADSIAEWDECTINGERAFDFLLRHSAIQWNNSISLDLRDREGVPDQKYLVGLTQDGDEIRKVSSAVPVDHRGYFLTASHCVPSGNSLIVLARQGKPPVEIQTTVIWNGDAGDGEHNVDLAILYAPLPDDMRLSTLNWSRDNVPPLGSPVLVAGAGATAIRLAGGHINDDKALGFKSISDTDQVNEAIGSSITIDAPLIPGDSGGPAILSDGSLLGIAVSTSLDDRPRSVLVRPDAAWVEAIIAAHQKQIREDGDLDLSVKNSALGWIRLQQAREELDEVLKQRD